VTLGCPVVMGRGTWDSLPARFRPLPGRLNVVVSRSGAALPGLGSAVQALGVDEALAVCAHSGADRAWVIGGAQIWAQAMHRADELVVTQLDLQIAGDTFAPPIDATVWKLVHREGLVSDQGLGLCFERYERTPD
jgi:dihydrofolate reductase